MSCVACREEGNGYHEIKPLIMREGRRGMGANAVDDLGVLGAHGKHM